MPTIVTLVSDFGSASPYPAAMKAVLLAHCDATIVDITHDVRRHDVRMGAYLLAAVVPWTPAGTVHLAVVDPGVGTARRPVIVEAGGQWFVGPDNGLLLPAARRLGRPHVFEITAREIVEARVSSTFHGRDIFAPAAARLVRGAPASALGEPRGKYVDLDFGTGRRSAPSGRRRGETTLSGSVIYVDPFGNLVTNIPADYLESVGSRVRVTVGRRSLSGKITPTYGDVSHGEVAIVPNGDGLIEVAVREGSAAALLQAKAGAAVRLQFVHQTRRRQR